MKLKLVWLVLLYSVLTSTSHAQIVYKNIPIDSLANQVRLYDLKNQSPVLFIHFDKTIYSNNENVWFTGYLLNCPDYSLYKTLSFVMVRDYDRRVVAEDRFVISNGRVYGNTFVPDSVGPGNYSFIAYTNRMVNGHLDVVFTQAVTIKAESAQRFNLSLNPIDTATTSAQKKVLLLVKFNEAVQPAAVPVSYYIGNASHPVLNGGITTAVGQYEFNIPSGMLSEGNNRLHVQLRYKREVKDLSMILPVAPQPAVVRFYPEGGNLVNNIQSTVGWEVKSAAGTALSVSAVLYQDRKIIDTIKTNSYGLGKFRLKPEAGSSYYVKLYGVNPKDTLYILPGAIMQGPVINLPQAIVNDVLTVNLQDERPEKLYMVIHNYKKIFLTQQVNAAIANIIVQIKLKDVPKGLTQLTIIDSLGRPFAERLFFAHYDQRIPLIITTDNNEYTTRQKVNVKVKLSGKTDSASVSIACVQENRLEIKKQNDIESYFYLKHDLEDIPVKENYLGNSGPDKQYLENILLIKGWRKYTWTDMLKTEPADTAHIIKDFTFRGYVTWFNDMLIKPVTVLNMDKPTTNITTTKTGNFTINDADLVTEPNKRVNFAVGGKHVKNYHIFLYDPYAEVNLKLAWLYKPNDYDAPALANTQYMQLPGNEHAIHLKEVNINQKKETDFHENECGDYVCTYDILNCPNHRQNSDNRPPVVGEKYEFNGRMIVYTGCGGVTEHRFKGIYTAQEFYPTDYSKDSPTQPEYLSTIYWKHLLKVSSTKEAEFSFYTSDITGRFKIIVQGVTSNDVTYGEIGFNVAKGK